MFKANFKAIDFKASDFKGALSPKAARLLMYLANKSDDSNHAYSSYTELRLDGYDNPGPTIKELVGKNFIAYTKGTSGRSGKFFINTKKIEKELKK